MAEQGGEGAQPDVDVLITGFDEAVGVQDQAVADREVEGDGLEGDAADSQRCPGGQVEQLGRSAGPGAYGGR